MYNIRVDFRQHIKISAFFVSCLEKTLYDVFCVPAVSQAMASREGIKAPSVAQFHAVLNTVQAKLAQADSQGGK